MKALQFLALKIQHFPKISWGFGNHLTVLRVDRTTILCMCNKNAVHQPLNILCTKLNTLLAHFPCQSGTQLSFSQNTHTWSEGLFEKYSQTMMNCNDDARNNELDCDNDNSDNNCGWEAVIGLIHQH